MTLDLSSVGAIPSDAIECVVVVTDPSGDSDQQSSSVTVLNTNPTIDVLTLNPVEPILNDTLSCYAESSDLDGDTRRVSLSPIRTPVLLLRQRPPVQTSLHSMFPLPMPTMTMFSPVL